MKKAKQISHSDQKAKCETFRAKNARMRKMRDCEISPALWYTVNIIKEGHT